MRCLQVSDDGSEFDTVYTAQEPASFLHMFRLDCFGFSRFPDNFEPFAKSPICSHAEFYLKACNARLATLERATFGTDLFHSISWCDKQSCNAVAYSRSWRKTGQLMELSGALADSLWLFLAAPFTLVSFGMSIESLMFAISQGNRNNDLWVIERFSGIALDFKTQELSHNAHSSFNGYCGVSALRICALCLYYIAGQRFLCPDIEDGFSLARLWVRYCFEGQCCTITY